MPFKSAAQEAYLKAHKPEVHAKKADSTQPSTDSRNEVLSTRKNRFKNYPSNRDLMAWNGKLDG
jgi:hypothetical protein